MSSVKIDLITEDPKNGEWVLYLVEEGPWIEEKLDGRLHSLQDRLYGAVDLTIDGVLASKFPESKGKKVRIQVDLYDSPPEDLGIVIRGIAAYLKSNKEYRRAIKESEFVFSIRIVKTLQKN